MVARLVAVRATTRILKHLRTQALQAAGRTTVLLQSTDRGEQVFTRELTCQCIGARSAAGERADHEERRTRPSGALHRPRNDDVACNEMVESFSHCRGLRPANSQSKF